MGNPPRQLPTSRPSGVSQGEDTAAAVRAAGTPKPHEKKDRRPSAPRPDPHIHVIVQARVPTEAEASVTATPSKEKLDYTRIIRVPYGPWFWKQGA